MVDGFSSAGLMLSGPVLSGPVDCYRSQANKPSLVLAFEGSAMWKCQVSEFFHLDSGQNLSDSAFMLEHMCSPGPLYSVA